MKAISPDQADAPPLPMVRAISRILGVSYWHLLGGKIYTFEEVADCLRTAQFAKVRRANLLKAPGISMIFGTKV